MAAEDKSQDKLYPHAKLYDEGVISAHKVTRHSLLSRPHKHRYGDEKQYELAKSGAREQETTIASKTQKQRRKPRIVEIVLRETYRCRM